MTSLASIRPDEWNFPLFLHVLGAMLLVGATLSGASALAFARGDTRMLRVGYWTLLLVGFPAYFVMRVGAEWLAEKEGFGEEGVSKPAWINIGWIVGDIGLPVFLVALLVGGVGVYRLRSGKGVGFLKVTLALSVLLLAAYVVAIWAMAGKVD